MILKKHLWVKQGKQAHHFSVQYQCPLNTRQNDYNSSNEYYKRQTHISYIETVIKKKNAGLRFYKKNGT